MALLLKWKKRTSTNVITEIYRSNSPIDKAALPPVLATLSNQETEYLDATANYGQTYHYMWVTYNMQMGSPAYSPSTPITVAQRRGVGPNTLLTGNADCGYYGDVTQSDLITTAGIQAAINPGAAALSTLGTAFNWRKMAYKGKILYVPSRPVFFDSWLNAYRAGIVYGNFDVSKLPFPPSGTIFAQNRRVTIAGDEYVIRLMKGYSDDPTITPPASINATASTATTTVDTTPSPRYDNEYDALWMGNMTICPSVQLLPNFPDAVVAGNGVRFGTITQELVTNNRNLLRGGAIDPNSLNMTRQGLALYMMIGSYSTAGAIIPVLELIES